MIPTTEDTLVGYLIDVRPSALTASLIDDEQGRAPVKTVGDEDILVGQVGSYVLVTQGQNQTLAMVTRISEQEKLVPLEAGEHAETSLRTAMAVRTVSLAPLGTINDDGEFVRGISQFPTTAAEVHVVGADSIGTMFNQFQAKGYDVGVLPSNSDQHVFLDPTALFGRHFAILGQTGSGKSHTVASLIQRAVSVMPKAHVIILDLHGEYSWTDDKGTRNYAFGEDIVRHIDARELEIPYWLMTFAELCDLLIDRTEMSAHNQLAVFRDAVNDLKAEEGKAVGLERTTLDTPIYFDILRLREIVEAKNGQVPGAKAGTWKNGPLTGAFDNFLMRLDSRMADVRYDFLLKPATKNASDTLSGLLRDFVGLGEPKRAVTIIDLSSVPFDVRPTVAAQIGRLAFEFNYWNPLYRDFPILLICEEAHAYITRASDSQSMGARATMERIAKEGRKYGVGLGVVSQRPHELSETVLAQCGSFICLRITNPADQAYVRSLVPEAERDLVDVMAGLGRGEAMVLGEAVPLPSRVQFYRPDPEPNSNDVDFYQKWIDGPDDIDVDQIVDRWRRQERNEPVN